MQFVKRNITIDFISKRKIGFVISILMIVISLTSLIIKHGPRFGIDFAGGTLIQVKFEKKVSIEEIKSCLESISFEKSSVQEFGGKNENEFLIKTASDAAADKNFIKNLKNLLKTTTDKKVEIRRVEMVGPQVGKDLREKALFAMFYALLFITIYISGRFELEWIKSGVMAGALMISVYGLSLFNVSIPFLIGAALIVTLILFKFLHLKYAMGAIAALIHDVAITVGIFSVFDKEFTLPIIAALLTIIGYSLNDTIIVFDRIRENFRKGQLRTTEQIINKSINETLSRTILTSLTTLLVLTSLFVFGGGIIHDFAFALIVGVVVGTYSSIFVASPILLAWHNKKR